MGPPVTLKLQSEGDVFTLRAQARKLAVLMGFPLNDQYRIDLCLRELAQNVLLYAGKGTVTLEIIHKNTTPGLQITCRDNGPGILDCEKALTDGWSTRSSLGIGLPSIRRLADSFKLYSCPENGTTIIIQKWLQYND